MTEHIIAAWAEDIAVRTNGLEKRTPRGYRVDVHAVGPGVVYDSAGVRVTAFAVEHGTWREAYGYRFDTPDRSVVISGDTKPSENLVRAATGADVLVHEVNPAARMAANATESTPWPTYMREFHTSDVELGRLAARIRPKLLILSHIIRRGATDEEMLAAVRQSFDGRVVVGHDLERF
ncbi:MAG: hypothetical protein DMD33_02185 [Gemmatimonadetes bacterium]|nr:MAG: hypothetical protein DMD33_02185 [Gemmatimonadota bacterium]